MITREIQPDPIRLFVGTDPEQHLAERALEASVRQNTSRPVQITWMRRGDPGWDWGAEGWATPFTLFRYAIPEACGHEGRAIYMDVDMLALGDLAELWEWPLAGAPAAATRRPDVILWDCAKIPPGTFQGLKEGRKQDYRRFFHDHPILPDEWDINDRIQFKAHEVAEAKILHFTVMRTQPWKPYRKRFPYEEPHPNPEVCELFWQYAAKGGVGQEIREAIETAPRP